MFKTFYLFHIDLNNSSPKGRNTLSIVESVDQFSLAVNFIKIISIYTKTTIDGLIRNREISLEVFI